MMWDIFLKPQSQTLQFTLRNNYDLFSKVPSKLDILSKLNVKDKALLGESQSTKYWSFCGFY